MRIHRAIRHGFPEIYALYPDKLAGKKLHLLFNTTRQLLSFIIVLIDTDETIASLAAVPYDGDCTTALISTETITEYRKLGYNKLLRKTFAEHLCPRLNIKTLYSAAINPISVYTMFSIFGTKCLFTPTIENDTLISIDSLIKLFEENGTLYHKQSAEELLHIVKNSPEFIAKQFDNTNDAFQWILEHNQSYSVWIKVSL